MTGYVVWRTEVTRVLVDAEDETQAQELAADLITLAKADGGNTDTQVRWQVVTR